jgi:hypothetical protein
MGWAALCVFVLGAFILMLTGSAQQAPSEPEEEVVPRSSDTIGAHASIELSAQEADAQNVIARQL